MATNYKYMNFGFDMKQFSDDLKRFRYKMGLTQVEMDEQIGVVLFQQYEWDKTDKLPTVRNFLLLCNWMDVDPRKYWVLSDD